jgi:hypothetical protein
MSHQIATMSEWSCVACAHARPAEHVATNRADEVGIWRKSSTHWVKAAIATELEVLKLFNSATGTIYQKKRTEKQLLTPSVIETPRRNKHVVEEAVCEGRPAQGLATCCCSMEQVPEHERYRGARQHDVEREALAMCNWVTSATLLCLRSGTSMESVLACEARRI